MSSATNIIKNVDELICFIDQDFDSYKDILDQIVADIVKANPTVSKVISNFVSYINVQLSDPPTRSKGLVLLNTFLPVCPHDLACENAVAWLNNSLKCCENETQISSDAFKVIKSLVETCHGTPEFNKSVTSGILNKIIEQVIATKVNSWNSITALECLETCLRLYFGPCGQFKSALEKYLIVSVDFSVENEYVRLAGKCLLGLQQVSGGGTQGVTHKLTWKTQHLRLCATLHTLMDQLFESLTEFGDFYMEDVSPLQLSPLPDGKQKIMICHRIVNVSTFLQEMLLGAYPVAKAVQCDAVLGVVSRGLTVTLTPHLRIIHTSLLRLLQALILCLGSNLIPFATLICKLITNNLKCTSSDTENGRVYCDLRRTAYQTLGLWVTAVKSAACVHVFASSFYESLIGDISPIKHELNLMITNTVPKHMSKKARKKLQEEQVTNSSIAKTYSMLNKKSSDSAPLYKAIVCYEALKTLQCVLESAGPTLSPVIHQQLQEFVVKTLFAIQRGNIVMPYSESAECKIELYRSVSSLLTCVDSGTPCALQPAVHLLTLGHVDTDTRVSAVCAAAIAHIHTAIHPTLTTLHFPIQHTNTSTTDTDEMDVSDVGTGIVPTQDVSTDPIESQQKMVGSDPTNESLTLEHSDSSTSPVLSQESERSEVIETLRLDEEAESDTAAPAVIHITEDDVSETEEKATDKVQQSDVIDLDEEDMCNAFVDILYE